MTEYVGLKPHLEITSVIRLSRATDIPSAACPGATSAVGSGCPRADWSTS